MIWTDPNTGRRWNVRQLGRVGGPTIGASAAAAGEARRGGPEGAIVLAFESLGADNESRVITGAPDDWPERSDVLAELFAEASRKRPSRS